jgi:type IV secretion system protein VirB1
LIPHAIALSALMARCAPEIAPSTMTAIVRVESGGDPLAIGDNTARRSYHPGNRASGEALARRLLEEGHSVDLGVAQIDNVNFVRFGVNVHTIFDACTNVSVGAKILAGNYAIARQRYGSGQTALRHAIGMYNTGQLDAGSAYVSRVLAAAGIHQDYEMGPRVIVSLQAPGSPTLVRAPVVRRQKLRAPSRVIAPSRAPILINVSKPSLVVLF